jgi:hypothetical protein
MRGAGTRKPVRALGGRLCLAFLWVWAAYWLAVLAFPASPAGGNLLGGASIQLVFVAITASCMYCFRPSADESWRCIAHLSSGSGVGRASWLGLALGTVGTGFILSDRIVIQGVDYDNGLAAARASWQSAADGRSGASSVLSVLGYMFGGCHFAAAVLVILRIHRHPTLLQSIVLIACTAVVLLSSAINGGRSSVLLFLVYCLSALLLNTRVCVKKMFLSPPVLLVGVFALQYSLAVFASRAALSGETCRDYTLEMMEYLQLNPSAWLTSCELPDALWLTTLAWAYLTHSFSTTCLIAGEPTTQSVMIGFYPILMLSKLGLVGPPDRDWFLAGRFPSLPGALYHQFGAVGLAGGSALLGVVTSVTLRVLGRFPHSLVALGAFLSAATTVFLSPELAAIDFLGFASAALGFVILAPFVGSAQQSVWPGCRG